MTEVYVAFRTVDYERGYLLGVFRTRIKAEQCYDKHKQYGDGYKVAKITINKVPSKYEEFTII